MKTRPIFGSVSAFSAARGFLLVVLLFWAALAVCAAQNAKAAPAQSPAAGVQANGEVTLRPPQIADLAGLLDSAEKEKLETQIAAFIKRCGVDLVLCTTDDAGGKSAREFADDYFDYNGYGFGDDFSGILLLIDMDNREVYVSTAGSAIAHISDVEVEKILDAMFDRITEGDYYGTFAAGIRAAARAIGREGAGLQFIVPAPQTLGVFAIIAAVAGALAVVIVLAVYRPKKAKDNYPFNTNARLDLKKQLDVFIGKNVTRKRIQRSSSSGGGGSSHTSSSGRSHGGGGRRF